MASGALKKQLNHELIKFGLIYAFFSSIATKEE
jgi:hypothetical protein